MRFDEIKSSKLTPKMSKQIREWRHECRTVQGGAGMCHEVSEIIEAVWDWERVSGTYCTDKGEIVCVAHYWNIMPDGSVLDSTADQFAEDDIRVIKPSDPEFKRYRPEWSDQYHPGHPDFPEDDPVHNYEWSGEFDDDWVDANPRMKGWNVADNPEKLLRLKKYYEEWIEYNNNAGADYGKKFAMQALSDVNKLLSKHHNQ